MVPDYVCFCTDGKVFFTSDLDQALAVANVSKVIEVSPVGRTPQQVVTISGTNPYAFAVHASVTTDASGRTKQRK